MITADEMTAVQLLAGIIGACKVIRTVKAGTTLKAAIERVRKMEAVAELLHPTELSVITEMMKRTNQEYDVAIDIETFTLEHYNSKTVYRFDINGRLTGVENESS